MNNEEKILGLLQTIVTDVNVLKAGQEDLRQNVVRMESELTEKIRGLYDFREVQNDVNDRVISALERIEAKVDVLQIETASIRRIK